MQLANDTFRLSSVLDAEPLTFAAPPFVAEFPEKVHPSKLTFPALTFTAPAVHPLKVIFCMLIFAGEELKSEGDSVVNVVVPPPTPPIMV